jgi:hypothetical protein
MIPLYPGLRIQRPIREGLHNASLDTEEISRIQNIQKEYSQQGKNSMALCHNHHTLCMAIPSDDSNNVPG